MRERAIPAALPALIVCGWALLMAAWLMGDPPFGAPDESAHYRRSLEVGRGNLITAKAPELASGGTERQRDWTRRFTRAIEIPAGLAPPPAECYVFHREISAACIDDFKPASTVTQTATYVGNYQPLPYLISGPVARAGTTPAEAVRLGRLGAALVPFALLVIAVAVLWDRAAGVLSLLGLLLAVTPMALFCGASLTGSGPEIAGGVAFFAALLRIARDREERSPPAVWVALAVSGAVLALSRTLGPLWIVLMLALAAGLIGPRESWALVRRSAGVAVPALAVVALAVVLNRVWEGLYGGGAIYSLESLRAVLIDSLSEWWRASSELIGKFSYLEYRLPSVVYVAWFGLGFGAIALGLRHGTHRERVALAAATAFAFVFPVVMWIGSVRFIGFGMQGRYVLPVLVAVPLLAGELIYRHRDRLSPMLRAALGTGVPVAIGLMQFVAWFWAARRSAVGTEGPLGFLGSAEWSPPAGWWPWLVLAALGAAAVAAAGLVGRRKPGAPAGRLAA